MIKLSTITKIATRILLFIVLPALAIACVMLYNKLCDTKKLATDLKQRREIVKEKIAVDAKIISRKYDKDSLRHATIEANGNEYTPASLSTTENILDTAALAIGILKKKIESLTIIASTSQAEKLKAYELLDSQKRQTFAYRDKFLKLAYRPASNKNDTLDKGEFDYAYNDSVSVIQYGKRKWLLAAKKSYIDIYSNDPRTTINGVKRLTVKQDVPTFGLRIQGISTYNVESKRILAGPAIRFDINRFSIQGARLYSPSFQSKPIHVVGLSYDFLRF